MEHTEMKMKFEVVLSNITSVDVCADGVARRLTEIIHNEYHSDVGVIPVHPADIPPASPRKDEGITDTQRIDHLMRECVEMKIGKCIYTTMSQLREILDERMRPKPKPIEPRLAKDLTVGEILEAILLPMSRMNTWHSSYQCFVQMSNAAAMLRKAGVRDDVCLSDLPIPSEYYSFGLHEIIKD